MTMNAEESGHFESLRGLVNDCESAHRSACDAADKGDMAAVNRHHTRLGYAIRSMQTVFANTAKAAVKSDMANSQVAKTSAGVSDSGGATAPWLSAGAIS